DGDDGIIPAGRLSIATDLRATNHASGFEIGVQVFLIVRELVFEDVDIGVLDMGRNIVAFAVAGVLLVVGRIFVRGHIGPIGEVAVNGDLARRLGQDRARKEAERNHNANPQTTHELHRKRPPDWGTLWRLSEGKASEGRVKNEKVAGTAQSRSA